MAYHDPDKQAKYTMKRVDRFVGHAGWDREIAQGDGIRYILGGYPGSSDPVRWGRSER